MNSALLWVPVAATYARKAGGIASVPPRSYPAEHCRVIGLRAMDTKLLCAHVETFVTTE